MWDLHLLEKMSMKRESPTFYQPSTKHLKHRVKEWPQITAEVGLNAQWQKCYINKEKSEVYVDVCREGHQSKNTAWNPSLIKEAQIWVLGQNYLIVFAAVTVCFVVCIITCWCWEVSLLYFITVKVSRSKLYLNWYHWGCSDILIQTNSK